MKCCKPKCNNDAEIVMRDREGNEFNMCIGHAINASIGYYRPVRKINALRYNEIEIPAERLEILE